MPAQPRRARLHRARNAARSSARCSIPARPAHFAARVQRPLRVRAGALPAGCRPTPPSRPSILVTTTCTRCTAILRQHQRRLQHQRHNLNRAPPRQCSARRPHQLRQPGARHQRLPANPMVVKPRIAPRATAPTHRPRRRRRRHADAEQRMAGRSPPRGAAPQRARSSSAPAARDRSAARRAGRRSGNTRPLQLPALRIERSQRLERRCVLGTLRPQRRHQRGSSPPAGRHAGTSPSSVGLGARARDRCRTPPRAASAPLGKAHRLPHMPHPVLARS